ncbi:MAG: hypothetical protein ACLFM5_10010 [Spirochaetaceae bacterium]
MHFGILWKLQARAGGEDACREQPDEDDGNHDHRQQLQEQRA